MPLEISSSGSTRKARQNGAKDNASQAPSQMADLLLANAQNDSQVLEHMLNGTRKLRRSLELDEVDCYHVPKAMLEHS